MPDLEIHCFPCLTDNYGVLVHDPASGETLAIDAPSAAAITAQLRAKGWRLTQIFNTHHHADHTGGNLELKEATGCRIVGPVEEAQRIPGLDTAVSEGTHLHFAGAAVTVIDTPGHTIGHISYYLPKQRVAFTGDTLFSLGCGRIFEGTPQMMWRSLEKLIALPSDTTIYCGHEYTLGNAKFALTVEPDNAELVAMAENVRALRAKDAPTIPTTLAAELAANPFLRVRSRDIRRQLGMMFAPDWEVFAELRQRKNKA